MSKNIELNKIKEMDEINHELNINPLIEDVKRAIIDFYNREYETNYNYSQFNALFPDYKRVPIASIDFNNKLYNIKYELNLEDIEGVQYLNNEELSKINYVQEYGNKKNALEEIKYELQYGNIDDFMLINVHNLKSKFNLDINQFGEIYDPLSKDMDNDGIIDRYDYDVKNSDYFKSTYDVDNNSLVDKIDRLEKEINNKFESGNIEINR